MTKYFLSLLSLGLLVPFAIAQEAVSFPQKRVAVWSFEQLLGGAPNFRFVYEPTAGTHDKVEEFPTLAEGVVGNALKLDGQSTRLTRRPIRPRLSAMRFPSRVGSLCRNTRGTGRRS